MQVLLEVTGQLERHQEVLVAAAEKQEQPRGTFTNDGKGVKALGVLPQTEALAAATQDLATLLKAGIPGQQWWMPWGEEVRMRWMPSWVPPVTSATIAAHWRCLERASSCPRGALLSPMSECLGTGVIAGGCAQPPASLCLEQCLRASPARSCSCMHARSRTNLPSCAATSRLSPTAGSSPQAGLPVRRNLPSSAERLPLSLAALSASPRVHVLYRIHKCGACTAGGTCTHTVAHL